MELSAASTQNNLEIVEDWFEEVWNNKNEAYIDKHFAKGAVANGFGYSTVGPEAYKDTLHASLKAFPHIRIKVLDAYEAGNKISVHTEATLKTDEGATYKMEGICFMKIINGQVLYIWNSWDFLGKAIDSKQITVQSLMSGLSGNVTSKFVS